MQQHVEKLVRRCPTDPERHKRPLQEVDVPDALPRVDPMQGKMVLNRGSELVRHSAVVQAGRKEYLVGGINNSKVGIKLTATSWSRLPLA